MINFASCTESLNLVELDDVNIAGSAANDGYAVAWSNSTGKFILTDMGTQAELTAHAAAADPHAPYLLATGARAGSSSAAQSFGANGIKAAVVAEISTDNGVKFSTSKMGFYDHAVADRPAAYTPTNVTPDRSFDADTALIAEVADVLGTLIADLQSIGLLQ